MKRRLSGDQQTRRQPPWLTILLPSGLALLICGGIGIFLSGAQPGAQKKQAQPRSSANPSVAQQNGRPQLSPLPTPQEVWNCEVVVVGGSLGGVAAAAHAMQSGATTCLIELSPWLGGQVSSQGVSAVDESLTMRANQNFSRSWTVFKHLIQQQSVALPAWTSVPQGQRVADINSCWVGTLCFPPQAGAAAALQLLQTAAVRVPNSRWGTSIAFKGAEFDATGKQITAVYAVRRVPRQPDYVPKGRLSQELSSWYAWTSNSEFEKIPIRLQAPSGKHLIVIDATDTGELIGWAGIPHRLGSESQTTSGEVNAATRDDPKCTQAFTYPFTIAIHNDQGASLAKLAQLPNQSGYSVEEHRKAYDLGRFPMFEGRSFFHYRRIVSTTLNPASLGLPAPGDITLVNWSNGNDWSWTDSPLILTDQQLEASGQRQNWLGGISPVALKKAESHAFLFAQWLLETKAEPEFPLTYLSGAASPMGTVSGLSMVPYIREGRRILGRKAYGQPEFMIRESDIRTTMTGRDFRPTTIALTHYDVDIHGCRHRNGEAASEANSAPTREYNVRPVQIPLESLIPQGVDNLLIGGKSIAVTHIVNAVTRVHYGEWGVGAAAGATAGWLVTQAPTLKPADIVPKKKISELQQQLMNQNLHLNW